MFGRSLFSKGGNGKFPTKLPSVVERENKMGQITPYAGEVDKLIKQKANLTTLLANEQAVQPHSFQYKTIRKAITKIDMKLAEINEESVFEEDFRCWLMGKGKDQDHNDHSKCWWGRQPLNNIFNRDIQDYLANGVNASVKWDEWQAKIRAQGGPKTRNESLIWFKYVIRGAVPDNKLSIFLEDGNVVGLDRLDDNIASNCKTTPYPTGKNCGDPSVDVSTQRNVDWTIIFSKDVNKFLSEIQTNKEYTPDTLLPPESPPTPLPKNANSIIPNYIDTSDEDLSTMLQTEDPFGLEGEELTRNIQAVEQSLQAHIDEQQQAGEVEEAVVLDVVPLVQINLDTVKSKHATLDQLQQSIDQTETKVHQKEEAVTALLAVSGPATDETAQKLQAAMKELEELRTFKATAETQKHQAVVETELELRQTRRVVSSLISDESAYKQAITRLKEELAQVNQELKTERTNTAQQIADIKEQFTSSNQLQVKDAKFSIEDVQTQLVVFQEEKQKEVDDIVNKYKSQLTLAANNRIKNANVVIGEMKVLLEDTNNQKESLLKERNKSKDALAIAEQQILALKTDNTALEDKITKEQEEHTARIKAITNNEGDVTNKLGELTKLNTAQGQKLNTLNKELQASREKQSELQRIADSHQSQVTVWQSKHDQLQQQTSGIQRNLSRLQTDLQSKQTEIKNLTDVLQERSKQLQIAYAQKGLAENDRAALKAQADESDLLKRMAEDNMQRVIQQRRTLQGALSGSNRPLQLGGTLQIEELEDIQSVVPYSGGTNESVLTGLRNRVTDLIQASAQYIPSLPTLPGTSQQQQQQQQQEEAPRNPAVTPPTQQQQQQPATYDTIPQSSRNAINKLTNTFNENNKRILTVINSTTLDGKSKAAIIQEAASSNSDALRQTYIQNSLPYEGGLDDYQLDIIINRADNELQVLGPHIIAAKKRLAKDPNNKDALAILAYQLTRKEILQEALEIRARAPNNIETVKEKQIRVGRIVIAQRLLKELEIKKR